MHQGRCDPTRAAGSMPKWRMTAQRRVASSPASGQRPRGGAATCPSAWGHGWVLAGWSRAIGQPASRPSSAAGRVCRKCVTRGKAMVGRDGHGNFVLSRTAAPGPGRGAFCLFSYELARPARFLRFAGRPNRPGQPGFADFSGAQSRVLLAGQPSVNPTRVARLPH